MEVSTLLWIDLCLHHKSTKVNHYAIVSEHFPIHRVNTEAAIPAAIGSIHPRILCFEYDYPLRTGLQALLETKTNYPLLPIILLTEKHSEDLAVWALRIHVWDYFVKPIDSEELLRNINILSETCMGAIRKEHWQGIMPVHSIPKLLGCDSRGKAIERRNTYSVVDYLHTHFNEELSLTKTAHLFGMQPSQFSKKFKFEQGINFHEFVTQYRIGKALNLLKNSPIHVTEVAFAVGFNDPSHFSRIFRRYVGLSPTQYRQQVKSIN